MTEEDTYTLFFDGCSKGNPGLSGAGIVLYKNNTEICKECIFVGENETNNFAEYKGLLLGLNVAHSNNIKVLTVKGDSLLVVKQMRGEYKVNSSNLIELYRQAKKIVSTFDTVYFIHIGRNENKIADEQANNGLLLSLKHCL